jgi:simple sugar transport system permease protein
LSSSPYPVSRRSSTALGGFGLFYLLGGALVLWMAWGTAPEAVSTLRFARLGNLMLSTRWVMILCAALGLVTGILGYIARPASRVHRVSLGMNALGLVCLVLVWASMGRRLEVLGILAQSVRLATPIALGALAGILSERSGVVNIAIEGMMLSAACLGFMIALYAANAWVGVLAAVAAGGTMAAFHAVLSIQWRVDQIISGMVINMLAVGLTGFIRRTVLLHNAREAPAVLPTWTLPVLSDLPVLRQLFGRHQPLVYAMLLLVLLVHILLFYTRWGLRTRAVGEHPHAADTVGINVFAVR